MAKKAQKARRRVTAVAVRPRVDLDRAPVAPGIVGLFEKIARDPNLTVDKLAALIDLQERVTDREAVAQFDAAYRAMLPEIPRISRRGAIKVKGAVQSRYSRYEDIRKTCDPILQRFGFTFHSRTEWPATGVLEVVGVLEHEKGGKRESRFRSQADPSGNKNAIQGLGSGVSYGKRYTIKDLLSIVEEGADDDGQKWGEAQEDEAPAGVVDVEPVAGHHAAAGEVISEAQLRRFHAIVKNSGREDMEVKDYLHRVYKLTSSRQITRDIYDRIVKAIEGPGALR